jgi:hypothetical protein
MMKAKSLYLFLAVSGILASLAVRPAMAELVQTGSVQVFPMHQLPSEILQQDIFPRLSFSELVVFSSVCKSWNQLVRASDHGYQKQYLQDMMGAKENFFKVASSEERKRVLNLIKIIANESTFGK